MLNGDKMGFVTGQSQDCNISVREACQALIAEGGNVGIYVVASVDSIKECAQLVAKCKDVVATGDILDEPDLESCGFGRLVPFLSKMGKNEYESAVITRGSSIDKIRPIIFG